MDIRDFTLNMAVATVLGAAIGFERQVHQRRAGLRTNVLVALGSAAFVTIGAFVPTENSESRVAAAVVSGVGFLGAGVIFKDGATIKGLDTAATVWCSAAVGSLAGWGQLAAAGVCTAIILLTNTFVRPLVQRIDRKHHAPANARATFLLTITCSGPGDNVRNMLLARLELPSLTVRGIHRTRDRTPPDASRCTITAEVAGRASDADAIEAIAHALAADPRVESAAWRIETASDAAEENGHG